MPQPAADELAHFREVEIATGDGRRWKGWLNRLSFARAEVRLASADSDLAWRLIAMIGTDERLEADSAEWVVERVSKEPHDLFMWRVTLRCERGSILLPGEMPAS